MTYESLLKLYQNNCRGNKTPACMRLSIEDYEQARELIKKVVVDGIPFVKEYKNEIGLLFHGCVLLPHKNIKDGLVEVEYN